MGVRCRLLSDVVCEQPWATSLKLQCCWRLCLLDLCECEGANLCTRVGFFQLRAGNKSVVRPRFPEVCLPVSFPAFPLRLPGRPPSPSEERLWDEPRLAAIGLVGSLLGGQAVRHAMKGKQSWLQSQIPQSLPEIPTLVPARWSHCRFRLGTASASSAALGSGSSFY